MPDQADAPAIDEPAAPKRSRRRWVRLILFLSGAYVFWCAILYLFQDWLLFPSGMTRSPSPQARIDGTVVIALELEGGGAVESWFIPVPGCDGDHPAPVVIFFHGNAELIDDQEYFVGSYHRLGYSVLLCEYRGYGQSGGKPSQRAIAADTVRFYDALARRSDVDSSRIVFHGRSLGGAVAADLASRRTPAAWILQSAFSSVTAMAKHYLAPAFLVRHPFRTDQVVESLDVPLLILHGTNDRVIPESHGRNLYALAADAKYVTYPCGHNDLPNPDNANEYWKEIEMFLSRTVGRHRRAQ